MPARLLSVLRFARVWRCLAAVVAALCLSVAAHAQSAKFSYAVQTLGGGFTHPLGIAVDGSGNVYATDEANSSVFEIPSGCASSSCVTTIGGGFSSPEGLATDSFGDVYVADYGHKAVKEIPSGCPASACVLTLGGGFNGPTRVAVDGTGKVYVIDPSAVVVKVIPPNCTSSSCVTSLSGFTIPGAVAVDSSGDVYVADEYTAEIVEFPSGCSSASCSKLLGAGANSYQATALAADGSGNVYFVEAPSNNAVFEIPSGCASSSCVTTVGGGFSQPQGVATDSSGNVYVADTTNAAVKKILNSVVLPSTAVGQSSTGATLTFTFTASGKVQVVRGVTQGYANIDFSDAGTGTCTTNGSSHTYNVGDTCTVAVKFSPKYSGLRLGAVVLYNSSISPFASALVSGIGTGPQAVFNAPLTATGLGGGFNSPEGVAVDGGGNVYVADPSFAVIKEIPAGCAAASCVTTLGGGFSQPFGVAVDGAGNVYVGDTSNDAVKEIPVGCAAAGCVTTLGGGFSSTYGVAVDGSGNVYVTDYGNNAVKEIPAGCAAAGCVTTLGGGFRLPEGVAVDGIGNVYVADYGHAAVKEIPAGCAASGCVKTLGGSFYGPAGVAVDAGGNVYVALPDAVPGSVQMIPPNCASSSCVTTVGTISGAGPEGVALDGGGNLYVASNASQSVFEQARAVTPSITFATSTPIGSPDTTDGTQTATLANIGNQALTFAVPPSGFNPSFPSGFRYDSSSTCAQLATSSSTATLAAGATCTLGIDFQPTAAGTNSGSVVFTDTSLNAASTTQSIAVSGTGLKATPTVTVSAAVSYYGTSSVTLSATVAYTGTSAPTGAFTFQVGSGTAFAATCTGSGSPLTCTASYSTGSLAVGSYTVTGSLAADSLYNSASSTATLTVTANASNPETESVLWNFANSSGSQSQSSLIQASDGNFYGTASYGGSCTAHQEGCGTIFQITPSGTYTAIHTFAGSDGCFPAGSLVQGTDGNLYGTTAGSQGGACAFYGTVYKIAIVPPYTFTLLHTFSTGDGFVPLAGLVQGNDGNLYGTTSIGGANSLGTVFKISPTSPYTLTLLHTFAGGTNDGQTPYGALVQGTDGNFYGTTLYGGATNNGTVFKISPASPYAFTLLHSFYLRSGSSDGGTPYAGLVQGTDGNFYGTTPYGGANNTGIAFKISPTPPYTETVLHTFANASTDGDAPYYGALFEGSDGNFYGTTKSAGANGVGLAYSINPSSPYTLSLLHSFASATTDGNTPYGGLAQGADGNFYGTTNLGGTNGQGVIYKLTPGSTLAAPVSLSAPASVSAGATFTLSYAVLNAPPAGAAVGTLQQCFATNTAGDTTFWTGVKTGYTTTTNASLTAPSTPGTYTYTLTCGGTESNSVTVTVTAAATAVSVSSSSNEVPANTAVIFYAQISPSLVNNSGTVTFSANGFTIPGCFSVPVSLAEAVCTAYLTTPGTVSVVAAYSGGGSFASSTSDPFSETVDALTPTISFGSLAEKHTADAPFTVAATSNSVGAFTYSLVSGPATVSASGLVTLTGSAGQVKIQATQAASGSYASNSATASFLVAAGSVWAVNGGGGFGMLDLAGNAFSSTAFTGGGLATVSTPGTIAFDHSGNAWIASANGVSEFNLDGVPVSTTAYTGGGIASPVALAVDGAGMIWIANANSTLSLLANTGAAVSPASGYPATAAGTPGGLTIDLSGNVWVTNQTANTVTEIVGAAAPAAPASTALANGTTGAKP